MGEAVAAIAVAMEWYDSVDYRVKFCIGIAGADLKKKDAKSIKSRKYSPVYSEIYETYYTLGLVCRDTLEFTSEGDTFLAWVTL